MKLFAEYRFEFTGVLPRAIVNELCKMVDPTNYHVLELLVPSLRALLTLEFEDVMQLRLLPVFACQVGLEQLLCDPASLASALQLGNSFADALVMLEHVFANGLAVVHSMSGGLLGVHAGSAGGERVLVDLETDHDEGASHQAYSVDEYCVDSLSTDQIKIQDYANSTGTYWQLGYMLHWNVWL